MSAQLDELEHKETALADLLEVIEALRAVTAVRWQQAESLHRQATAYAGSVRACARSLEHPVALAPGPAACVVFTPEHGFVGPLAERLLDAATDPRPSRLFIVGGRGVAAAAERGLTPHWTGSAASHAAALVDMLAPLCRAIGEGGDSLPALEIVGSRIAEGRAHIRRRPVLPPEPANRGPCPIIQVPTPALLRGLAGQVLLAELALAAAESYATEQFIRLQTLTGSRERIAERLGETRILANQGRQERIGQEISDLLSGAAA